MKDKVVVVKSGRLQGKEFRIEGTIEEVWGLQPGYGKVDLPYLACVMRNPAAMNALDLDKYIIDDGPFYYGKIGSLGYILGTRDLP